MLTDYFAFGVALDALSTAIPGENSAFWTKEENGIILHALDKQAENLVALPQVLLRVLVLKLFQRVQSFPLFVAVEARPGMETMRSLPAYDVVSYTVMAVLAPIRRRMSDPCRGS